MTSSLFRQSVQYSGFGSFVLQYELENNYALLCATSSVRYENEP